MKKTILILSSILLNLILNAQNVNIPDANFKAALVADISINTNMDTEIQVSEAVAYTGSIYVNNLGILDMTGLDAFINIWGLDCSNNNISVLDITNNTHCSTLHCDNNAISVLDLTNTPMYFLTCSHNNISSLYLDDSEYLNTLYCDHNGITSLNLDNCTYNLVTVVCNDNFLTDLSIKNGNNDNIDNSSFYAINNPALTCIEVDNPIWSQSNWTNIDPTSSYSSNCSGSPVFISQDILTNVLCNGDCNGDISVTVSGGTPGYTYSWVGPSGYISTNEDISGLCAGTYDLTVTDGVSTTSTASFNVIEPTPITITATNVNNTCSGQCDGTITVSASGGTPIYAYNWNTGIQLCVVSNLCPGTYTVTVTDAAGCTNSLPVVLSGYPQITGLNEVITDANCGLSDGGINITVSNGAPPFTYLWSNSAASEDLNFIPSGTYSVTITDVNGCTYTDSFIVQNIAGPTSSITYLTNVHCYGNCDGTAVVTGSGGTTPYTYLWDANAGNQTSDTAINLCAGNYSVTVTDNIGCFSISNVTITQPTFIALSSSSNIVSCNGYNDGTATVNVTGGVPPYTYFWDANAGNQNTQTAVNLAAGTYCVTVYDVNACTETICTTVIEPSVLNIFNDSITNTTHGICNGSIDFSAVGGVPPYDYFWSTGDTTNTLDMLCPETYDVTITDSNGCIFQTSFDVGSSYDSSYTFVDTIYVQIDTCIFNNTLPVDSALVYNYIPISSDSILLNWIFWQDGNSILLDIGVHIDTPGSNLIYLEIDCGTKAQYVYDFYGVVDVITNVSRHKQELPDVNIYPNPTSGKITIEAEGIRNIKLLNIEGRKVYSGVDHEIDISKESKGIFIIIVTTDTGFNVRKIVLE